MRAEAEKREKDRRETCPTMPARGAARAGRGGKMEDGGVPSGEAATRAGGEGGRSEGGR